MRKCGNSPVLKYHDQFVPFLVPCCDAADVENESVEYSIRIVFEACDIVTLESLGIPN